MTTNPIAPVNRFPAQLAGFFLLVIVGMNLPGLLCMGLDIDTTTFDLYLRGMQEGRILYQDMIENNLPGVMWIHILTRSLFGWSSVALQAVDLVIIGGAIALMCAWPRGITLAARIWMAIFLCCFYFSTSEWVHCQRDPWTMLPMMGAMHLRRAQLERIITEGGGLSRFGWGILEGLIWGFGIWIKPYLFVPAMLICLMGLYGSRRRGAKVIPLAVDLLGLLTGGLICGAMGIAWMKANHCWEPYLQHMRNLREFYFAADMYSPHTIYEWRIYQFFAFYPWSLVTLGGLLFGLIYLVKRLRHRAVSETSSTLSRTLFFAGLLGFFIQAIFLQHAFDYAVAPVVLIGLAWVAIYIAETVNTRERVWLAFLCGLTAFMGHVPILKQRLPIWSRCIQEGSTWEIRDKLLILRRTEWNSLAKVKEYLESRQVKDGELTVFVEGGLPLYEAMGLRPTTRSYMMTNQIISLPYRRRLIFEELQASRQRFVFTSTLFMKRDRENLKDEPAQEHEPLPDYWRGSRDWTKYVVFRSGMYMILEMPPELTSDWCRECLGL